MLATGFSGGGRDHFEIAYDGLEVADASKKDVTLHWPEHDMTVKGCLKQMLPALVDAINANSRPAA